VGAAAAAASTSASFSCCMSCGLPLVLGGIVCDDDATCSLSPQSRSTKKAAENVQKMSSGLNIHKKISVCNFTS
jgi:hypothetical protein